MQGGTLPRSHRHRAPRAGSFVPYPPAGSNGSVPIGSFVLRLDGWRQELGRGHNAFARYLGISPSHWSKVRRGERNVGPALITRVLRERPDLSALVAGEFTRR